MIVQVIVHHHDNRNLFSWSVTRTPITKNVRRMFRYSQKTPLGTRGPDSVLIGRWKKEKQRKKSTNSDARSTKMRRHCLLGDRWTSSIGFLILHDSTNVEGRKKMNEQRIFSRVHYTIL